MLKISGNVEHEPPYSWIRKSPFLRVTFTYLSVTAKLAGVSFAAVQAVSWMAPVGFG